MFPLKRSLTAKFLLTVCSIFLTFFAVEMYLHKRGVEPEEKNPYAVSFHVDTGEKILKKYKKGNLKLTIAPFTITKNLPNQKTEAFQRRSIGTRVGNRHSRDTLALDCLPFLFFSPILFHDINARSIKFVEMIIGGGKFAV